MQQSPLFQRRHYEAIAKIINNSTDRLYLVNQLNRLFEADNPNYEPQRFYEACGIDPVSGQPINR